MKWYKSLLGITAQQSPRTLTRKELYDLAAYCRTYSMGLAKFDQTRVNLGQCYHFNKWLPGVKAYDLLKPRLASLKPARPISRWQVMTLVALSGLILYFAVGRHLNQTTSALVLYGIALLLVTVAFFLPERLYGTTIELLEGKVLRVVDAMEQALQDEELGFTEAAYFKVKEDLEVARRELRQQIDLAHRRWR